MVKVIFIFGFAFVVVTVYQSISVLVFIVWLIVALPPVFSAIRVGLVLLFEASGGEGIDVFCMAVAYTLIVLVKGE